MPLSVGKVICHFYVFERGIIRAFLVFANGIRGREYDELDSGEKCLDCLIKS